MQRCTNTPRRILAAHGSNPRWGLYILCGWDYGTHGVCHFFLDSLKSLPHLSDAAEPALTGRQGSECGRLLWRQFRWDAGHLWATRQSRPLMHTVVDVTVICLFDCVGVESDALQHQLKATLFGFHLGHQQVGQEASDLLELPGDSAEQLPAEQAGAGGVDVDEEAGAGLLHNAP